MYLICWLVILLAISIAGYVIHLSQPSSLGIVNARILLLSIIWLVVAGFVFKPFINWFNPLFTVAAQSDYMTTSMKNDQEIFLCLMSLMVFGFVFFAAPIIMMVESIDWKRIGRVHAH